MSDPTPEDLAYYEHRLTKLEGEMRQVLRDIERFDGEIKLLRDFRHKAGLDIKELLNDKDFREEGSSGHE